MPILDFKASSIHTIQICNHFDFHVYKVMASLRSGLKCKLYGTLVENITGDEMIGGLACCNWVGAYWGMDENGKKGCLMAKFVPISLLTSLRMCVTALHDQMGSVIFSINYYKVVWIKVFKMVAKIK